MLDAVLWSVSATGSSTRSVGARAEDTAVRWLRRRGYRILARNVHYKPGELDVVALDGETLCFVEIKFRTRRDFGPAVAAVGWKKQRRIAAAARLYLAANSHRGECRFDVLGIQAGGQEWEFELVRGAFDAP